MMLGKRKKTDTPAFIKPHTQGTSNEISFDVLDRKRTTAEDPTPPAWEFSHAEVENRKRKRVRNKRLVFSAMILVIAAACVFVGMLIWNQFHNQMDNIQQLRQTLVQVQEENARLGDFKKIVTNSLTLPLDSLDQALAAEYETANATATAVNTLNTETKQKLESLQATLQAADLEAANQGIAALNADHNMIELGRNIMSYVLSAIDGYAQAENALQAMLTADSLARESAALMESQTIEGAHQSIAKSNECIEELNRVKSQLQTASRAYEALPKLTTESSSMSSSSAASSSSTSDTDASNSTSENNLEENPIAPFIEYVDLRIQAQYSAIESTQAYIDRNKETLVQANDTYNSLEAQAADLIAQQPLYPAEALAAAYAATCSVQSEQWNSEVARATAAVKAVQDYLG